MLGKADKSSEEVLSVSELSMSAPSAIKSPHGIKSGDAKRVESEKLMLGERGGGR